MYNNIFVKYWYSVPNFGTDWEVVRAISNSQNILKDSELGLQPVGELGGLLV